MFRERDIIIKIQIMENAITEITKEMEMLKKIIPENKRLHVIKHRTGYQYYQRERGGDSNGTYIKKDDMDRAASLVQMEYDKKLLVALGDSLRLVKKLQTKKLRDPFQYILDRMAPGKKELVKQYYFTDEGFINKWRSQKYERMAFREEMPEFYSRAGLRVRSKSEVFIADILEEMGIPFYYEKPLRLKSGTIYPDFTLLNIKERKEVYWEHFGMMDDKEYRDAAYMKIRKYEAEGLFQYDAVIWTFETSGNPVNTRELRKMVRKLRIQLGYE